MAHLVTVAAAAAVWFKTPVLLFHLLEIGIIQLLSLS